MDLRPPILCITAVTFLLELPFTKANTSRIGAEIVPQIGTFIWDTLPKQGTNQEDNCNHPTACKDVFYTSAVYTWFSSHQVLEGEGQGKYVRCFSGCPNIFKIKLANGSTVTLNNHSSFIYHTKIGTYNGLSGVAYIETGKNPTYFIVNKDVKVLVSPFTSINLKSCSGSNFSIILFNGALSILNKDFEQSFRKCGKEYVFDTAGNKIATIDCDTTLVKSWSRNAEFLKMKNNHISVDTN